MFRAVCANALWDPKKPEIFSNFSGPCMHTAEWDHSVSLDGKIVGVVGSGASGIQVIPSIVDQVKELHSFQRNPNWIFYKFFDINISKCTRKVFRALPFLQKAIRTTVLCGCDLASIFLFKTNSLYNRIG